MKQIIGIVLILAGIVAGLYFGLWWAFIGGIIQIIDQVRAEHMDATVIAFGICKAIFAGIIGWASAAICLIPGMAFLQSR